MATAATFFRVLRNAFSAKLNGRDNKTSVVDAVKICHHKFRTLKKFPTQSSSAAGAGRPGGGFFRVEDFFKVLKLITFQKAIYFVGERQVVK